MTSTASPSTTADISAIVDAHMHLEGPLLPILHAVQAAFGYLPDEARAPIADALNITHAELHGVISFYHDFRSKPAGAKVIKICRAEACQAMGANALADEMQKKLGLKWGQTLPNGAVTLEPIYCLGLCACGPAAMVDGQLRGRATADALIAEVTS